MSLSSYASRLVISSTRSTEADVSTSSFVNQYCRTAPVDEFGSTPWIGTTLFVRRRALRGVRRR
uniref:Uncharacterized protein n=1 Tax=uncultured marine virus TaxID=186617 RepID=A0A0F7L923_9VIRU|nr:hypothetical protein [uncultured marine virus]